MQLLVLRHAQAQPEANSDAERALTKKGVSQARKVGEFCRRSEIHPALIVTSPLVRARQTAEQVARELKMGDQVESADFLRPGMSPDVALQNLQRYAERASVMIVGHEPDLSTFLEALTGSNEEALQMKKATLAKVSLPKLEPGLGILEYLLPVALL